VVTVLFYGLAGMFQKIGARTGGRAVLNNVNLLATVTLRLRFRGMDCSKYTAPAYRLSRHPIGG
jgi:hypothetical protein